MATIFESFLARHKQTAIDQMCTQLYKNVTVGNAEATLEVTTTLINFYYGRMLGTIEVDDPITQTMLAAAVKYKVSRETIALNRSKFFDIMHQLCTADSAMNKSEQAHVDRILSQSQKFLMADISIIKSQNLKPQND